MNASQSDVRGDILEIGAYKGKSAALLGYFIRPGERLVVCDLFDSAAESVLSHENMAENERFYSDLTLECFKENFRKFHSWSQSSSWLPPQRSTPGATAGRSA